MSKVRINDLAKELEVKSRAILDVLPELGVSAGKTHSSSLELDEAEKVRAHFAREARHTTHAGATSARHGAEAIVPKIDLSHISKPGDVIKALLAKKKEEEEEARHARMPAKPATAAPAKRRASSDNRRCDSGCREARCSRRAGSAGTTQDRSAAALCASDHCCSASHSCHCVASSRRRDCRQSSRRGCGRAPGCRCCAAPGWGDRETARGSGCAGGKDCH